MAARPMAGAVQAQWQVQETAPRAYHALLGCAFS
jgi:hypothetical protein